MTLRLATRSSMQARIQSEYVAAQLTAVTGQAVELVFVDTAGDRDRTTPLALIGGRGIFVKEVQQAVIDGRAEFAVHSAKDLPSSFHAEGLVLASVPKRGDARDALVGASLDELHRGSTVATGSARREAMLGALVPGLRFVSLRGNTPTRVARADEPEIDAVIAAVAGVSWVGLHHKLSYIFSPDQMVPQVGQGALALECRVDDAYTIAALQQIEDPISRLAVDAERAFLSELGGGCEQPVGAYATIVGDHISIVGFLATETHGRHVKATMVGDDSSVGAQLADQLRALLDA